MKGLANHDHRDDILLIRLIRAGNEEVFRYLFEKYFVSLSRFVCIYVHQPRIAEELVVDVFATIWEKHEDIEITVTLKAYLFQSVRNRALNYLRDHERFIHVADWTGFDYTETNDPVEINELEKVIREAICSLPDNCREIFQKSRWENLSNKEIAAEMHISVKTVEARITKAIKLIKQYLGKAYFYLW